MLCYTRMESLTRKKYSCFLDKFVSYKENKVLRIRHLILTSLATLKGAARQELLFNKPTLAASYDVIVVCTFCFYYKI